MEKCQTSKIPFKPARRSAKNFNFGEISKATVTDISSVTNRKITGKPAYWRTKNGNDNVEHLAATDLNNNLIVFWKTGSNPWKSVNVSEKAGHKVSGKITAWQTRNGPYNVEHLAARSLAGDLIVFIWSPQHDWQAVNVSSKTGRKIAGGPESWQTKSGTYNVEHLAARAGDGSLLVFWWSPLRDWQYVNISSKAGKKIKGEVVSWQVKNSNIEYLAAAGTNNNLLVFYWSPLHDWKVTDVTQKTNKKISGSITAWQKKNWLNNVEYLAAAGSEDNLLLFSRSSLLNNWQVIDVSAITGQNINGGPENYHFKEGAKSVDVLTSKNSDNELILRWWKADLDWQMINVSKITSVGIFGDPVTWTDSTSGLSEYIATEGPDNSLQLFHLRGRERQITDQIHRPVSTLSRKRNINSKVIAILWDPHRPGVTRPSSSEVESLVFGNTESVRQYFEENSNSHFTISKAAVAGWFDASYSPDEYWPPNIEDRPGRDSGREAIIKASQVFNFKNFDNNNDNNLSTEELGILFLNPNSRTGGLNRIVGEDYTSRQTATGIEINGLLITWIAEVSIGYTFNPDNIGIIAHELSHLLLGHGDMYVAGGITTEAGPYSLMDRHGKAPHIDPVAKLKFGWLKPEIIFSSGTYELQNIEASHKVYLLVHPQKGADEYFIIENRHKNTHYDRQIPYNGISIWHVTELSELYRNSVPPRNVTWKEWNEVPNNFVRKGIRAIRPLPMRTGERFKLWDGADPATGYPLTSNNNNPNQSALVWADGTASGFTIRNFSPAGATMSFEVIIPF